MEEGIVKFFDSRDGKKFGFITVTQNGEPTGEEIWFHFNEGQFIAAGGKEPEFEGDTLKRFVVHHDERVLAHPKKGDQVVFKRGWGKKGVRADPWGYLSQFDEAEKKLASRPIYRVFEHRGFRGEYNSDPKILWEGSDLEDLSKKFPLPTGSRSPGADPLISFWSHDDGPEGKHWFERQGKDESWERCDDPRPLPGVLRTFEAINR